MIDALIKQYHTENRYFDIFKGEPALITKCEHIKNVLNFTEKLYTTSSHTLNKELLLICAEHHDDGRVDQYKLLGKFLDTTVTHNVLSLNRFDKYITAKSDEKVLDQSIQILRDVMLYHGRPQLCISKNSQPYVDIITAADDLENASSCVSYLISEVETDAKGYCHNNPSLDQKMVSDFVLEHFASGIKFDKLRYCHTYAEYVLFAATLMTSCIKKYSFAKTLLSEPGYGYPSILDGYKEIFRKTLYPDKAEAAYKVLCNFKNGKCED